MAHTAVETTLNMIGGKYKPLILWQLSQGKLRFSDLRDRLQTITPKTLTQQLRELEAHKLIRREEFRAVPPKVEYSLTELGQSLKPILDAMKDWGSNYTRNHSK